MLSNGYNPAQEGRDARLLHVKLETGRIGKLTDLRTQYKWYRVPFFPWGSNFLVGVVQICRDGWLVDLVLVESLCNTIDICKGAKVAYLFTIFIFSKSGIKGWLLI